jgi:hypothetical protein
MADGRVGLDRERGLQQGKPSLALRVDVPAAALGNTDRRYVTGKGVS